MDREVLLGNTIASSGSMSLRGGLLFSRGNAWIIQPGDAVAWKAPTAFGARDRLSTALVKEPEIGCFTC